MSGEEGRYGGLLYFSEGAHYRERLIEDSSTGFLFDPNDLEYTFGAVPTRVRYRNVLDTTERFNDPELAGRNLKKKFLYPDLDKGAVSQRRIFSDTKEQHYISQTLRTMRAEAFGLEALLKFQRKYNIEVEPEFVVPHRVPLGHAIGVSDESGVYWIDPEKRGSDFNRWNLLPIESSELGGREPGSFSPGWVASLIIPEELRLHRRKKENGNDCGSTPI